MMGGICRSRVARALERHGIACIESPLGWWVLAHAPDGRVAEITELEPGQYRLTGLGPARVFETCEDLVDVVLRAGRDGRGDDGKRGKASWRVER
ncbi:MAG: hypothetical protein HY331_05735 [Chloroflexi bacterium]|nr:hypothetical protein [Chloroflexota bacterium]